MIRTTGASHIYQLALFLAAKKKSHLTIFIFLWKTDKLNSKVSNFEYVETQNFKKLNLVCLFFREISKLWDDFFYGAKIELQAFNWYVKHLWLLSNSCHKTCGEKIVKSAKKCNLSALLYFCSLILKKKYYSEPREAGCRVRCSRRSGIKTAG